MGPRGRSPPANGIGGVTSTISSAVPCQPSRSRDSHAALPDNDVPARTKHGRRGGSMPRDTDLPGEALSQRDPPTPPSARGLLALPLLLVGIRLARPSPSLALGPRSVVFLLRPALRASTCLSWRRRCIGYALAAALHGLRPQDCSGRRARPRAGAYATFAQLAASAAILCEPAFANRETRIARGGGTGVGRCCNRVYAEKTPEYGFGRRA